MHFTEQSFRVPGKKTWGLHMFFIVPQVKHIDILHDKKKCNDFFLEKIATVRVCSLLPQWVSMLHSEGRRKGGSGSHQRICPRSL